MEREINGYNLQPLDGEDSLLHINKISVRDTEEIGGAIFSGKPHPSSARQDTLFQIPEKTGPAM